MASHKLNLASSRSHCLFTLEVESCQVSVPEEIVVSKFTMVDLAGSEKSSVTNTMEGSLVPWYYHRCSCNPLQYSQQKNNDENCRFLVGSNRRKESIHINKSLLTLRKVISTLADSSGGKHKHVPYRDSKLTCMLKGSVGGASLTLMIACIANNNCFYDENLSTLDYASQTRQVINEVRNEKVPNCCFKPILS